MYAIGEVVLVVIGILIALQLNNVNENRKLEIQEINYLERLKNDLIQDTLYYNQRIEILNNEVENNTKAIKMAYQIQSDYKEFMALLRLYSYDNTQLTIQNDTYYEMTNAGNFNIIQNEDLKIAIIKLYRSSNEYAKHIKEYNEFTVLLLADLNTSNTIFKYHSYPGLDDIIESEKMFNDADWKFINDPNSYKFRVLENCMLHYASKHVTLTPYYIDLKSVSESIIWLINDELKSRNN